MIASRPLRAPVCDRPIQCGPAADQPDEPVPSGAVPLYCSRGAHGGPDLEIDPVGGFFPRFWVITSCYLFSAYHDRS